MHQSIQNYSKALVCLFLLNLLVSVLVHGFDHALFDFFVDTFVDISLLLLLGNIVSNLFMVWVVLLEGRSGTTLLFGAIFGRDGFSLLLFLIAFLHSLELLEV